MCSGKKILNVRLWYYIIIVVIILLFIPPVRRAHMASQLRKKTDSRPSLTHTNCMPEALYAVCRHVRAQNLQGWV